MPISKFCTSIWNLHEAMKSSEKGNRMALRKTVDVLKKKAVKTPAFALSHFFHYLCAIN